MKELRKPLIGLAAAILALAGAIVLNTQADPDRASLTSYAASHPA